jgi:hypothetical protein
MGEAGGQGTSSIDCNIFGGRIRSSEAAMGGGGRSAPFGMAINPKNGCAQRTGAHARPKPTSYYIFVCL